MEKVRAVADSIKRRCGKCVKKVKYEMIRRNENLQEKEALFPATKSKIFQYSLFADLEYEDWA